MAWGCISKNMAMHHQRPIPSQPPKFEPKNPKQFQTNPPLFWWQKLYNSVPPSVLKHGEGRLWRNARVPGWVGIDAITHGPLHLGRLSVRTGISMHQLQVNTYITPRHLLETVRASFWNATIRIYFLFLFIFWFFLMRLQKRKPLYIYNYMKMSAVACASKII